MIRVLLLNLMPTTVVKRVAVAIGKRSNSPYYPPPTNASVLQNAPAV